MGEAQNITTNVFAPCNCEFLFSKLFYASKGTDNKSQQSVWGFPGPEITWTVIPKLLLCLNSYSVHIRGKASLGQHASATYLIAMMTRLS